MKPVLVIDLGRCSECRGCVEIAPEIFRYNPETGFMEVADLPQYSPEKIREAIKNCPEDCIIWENNG
jgi:ferredoxin